MNIMNTTVDHFSRNGDIRGGVKMGKLLLDIGKIGIEDAERIIRLQKTENMHFGDAALKLGLINEADLQQVLSMQFDYPYLQTDQGSFSKHLVAAYQPFSLQVEALRTLRSQLILRWFNEGHKSLAVMSAISDDGCSYLAANLAVVFSQLGERTLLIDANLRNPSQHKIFNIDQRLGLSDILVGRADLDVVSRVEFFLDLTVLGAGTIPPNPHELLSRSNFIDLLDQEGSNYDVVIVDTAPASKSSDALTVASRCGGGLIVSRLNKTRLSDLENIRDQLTLNGVQIVGAVLN
jgi:chain length determinant protein tyrosine kinase EpsG